MDSLLQKFNILETTLCYLSSSFSHKSEISDVFNFKDTPITVEMKLDLHTA